MCAAILCWWHYLQPLTVPIRWLQPGVAVVVVVYKDSDGHSSGKTGTSQVRQCILQMISWLCHLLFLPLP